MGLHTIFIILLIIHCYTPEINAITNHGSAGNSQTRSSRYIGNRPPDWEIGLREATTQALQREDRRIPRLRDILNAAPLIGRQDIATPFGDIAILARGQLYSAPGGFQFVQEPYQNDCIGCHSQRSICEHEPCGPWRPRGREKLLALWTVKRIRHRDQRFGHKYELEYTISPISGTIRDAYVTRSGRFDYSLPGHVFLVKSSTNTNYDDSSKTTDNRPDPLNTYLPSYIGLHTGEIYLPGRHESDRNQPSPGYRPPGYIIALTPNGYKHIIRPYPNNRYETTSSRPLYHQHHHYYTEGTQNTLNTQAPDYYKDIINSILQQTPSDQNKPTPGYQYIPPHSNEIPSPIRPPSSAVIPPPPPTIPSTEQTYGSDKTTGYVHPAGVTDFLSNTFTNQQQPEPTTPSVPQSFYPSYSTQQTSQQITTVSLPTQSPETTKQTPPAPTYTQLTSKRPTILTINEITNQFIPSTLPAQPDSQRPFLPSTVSVQLTYQPSTTFMTRPTFTTSTKPLPPPTFVIPPKAPQTTKPTTFATQSSTNTQQTITQSPTTTSQSTLPSTKPTYLTSSTTQTQFQTSTLNLIPSQSQSTASTFTTQMMQTGSLSGTQQTTNSQHPTSASTTKRPKPTPPTSVTTQKRPLKKPPDTRPYRPTKPTGTATTPGLQPDKDDFADDLFGADDKKPSGTVKPSPVSTVSTTELDADLIPDIPTQLPSKPGKRPGKRPNKRPGPRPRPGRPGQKPGLPLDADKDEPEFDVDIFGGNTDKMDNQMSQSMQVLPEENEGANDIFSAAITKPIDKNTDTVDIFGSTNNGKPFTTQFPNQLSSEKFTQFTPEMNQGADEIFSATLNVQPNKSNNAVDIFPTKFPDQSIDKISESTQIRPIVNTGAEDVFSAALLPISNQNNTGDVFANDKKTTSISNISKLPSVPEINQGADELFSATLMPIMQKDNISDVFEGDKKTTIPPTKPSFPILNLGADELFSATLPQSINKNNDGDIFNEDKTTKGTQILIQTTSAKPINQGSDDIFSPAAGSTTNKYNPIDIFSMSSDTSGDQSKHSSTAPTFTTSSKLNASASGEGYNKWTKEELTSTTQSSSASLLTTTTKIPVEFTTKAMMKTTSQTTEKTNGKKPSSTYESEDVFSVSPTPPSKTSDENIFEGGQEISKPIEENQRKTTEKPPNKHTDELFNAPLSTPLNKNQSDNIFGEEQGSSPLRPTVTTKLPETNKGADDIFAPSVRPTTDKNGAQDVFEGYTQNSLVTQKKPIPTRPTNNYGADELFSASVQSTSSKTTEVDIFGQENKKNEPGNKRPNVGSHNSMRNEADELFSAPVNKTPNKETNASIFDNDNYKTKPQTTGRLPMKPAANKEADDLFSSPVTQMPHKNNNEDDIFGHSNEKSNKRKNNPRDRSSENKRKTTRRKSSSQRTGRVSSNSKNGKNKYSNSNRRNRHQQDNSTTVNGKTVIFSNFYESSSQATNLKSAETTQEFPTQQSYSTSITFEVNKTTKEYTTTTERYTNNEDSNIFKANAQEAEEENLSAYQIMKTDRPEEPNSANVKKELDKLALSLVNHARSIDYLNKQQLLKAKYKRRNYNPKSRRPKLKQTVDSNK